MKLVRPEETLLELARISSRPRQIVELGEKIEEEMRAAGAKVASTGMIDMAKVGEIVQMQLQLDELYARWAGGQLEDKSKIIPK